MDFNSLRDLNNVKALFVEIWKSLSTEVSKLKDINKDNFVNAFNKYFWDYLKDEYKKGMQLNLDYFKFEGRATRKQYWMFLLFSLLFMVLVHVLNMIIPLNHFFSFVLIVFGLITIIPNLSLAVRRMHDINLSGWWLVFGLMPYSGWLILIPLATKGDTKANNYGSVVK